MPGLLPLGGAGVVEGLLPFALGWVRIALAPAVLAVVAYRAMKKGSGGANTRFNTYFTGYRRVNPANS
jgi:hypothetical protein